jgi:hypothetical protein
VFNVLVQFDRMIVSWLSKKHNCVAKFIMKDEYISCITIVSNAIWINCFVNNLNLGILSKPVNIFCDKKSTITLAKSGEHNSKGKYIDLNYHYIQDIVDRSEIKRSLYSLNQDGGQSYDQEFAFG